MKAFFHLFIPKGEDAGIARMLLHEQMRTYEESGLAGVVPLTVGVIGTEYWRDRLIRSGEDHFRQYPFIERIIEHDMSENDENLYEGATLEPLWEYCRGEYPNLEQYNVFDLTEDREPILYFHSKGAVTMNRITNQHRLYMEEFVLRRWREAVARIEGGADIAGCDWRMNGGPHFAGNFWWAGSDYLSSLMNPRTDCAGFNRGYYHAGPEGGDNSRIKYEMWVGSGNPKVAVLHDSGVGDWYREEYPPKNYRNGGV